MTSLRKAALGAFLIALSLFDLRAQTPRAPDKALPGDLSTERGHALDEAALAVRARAVGGLPRLSPSDGRNAEAIRGTLSATLTSLGVDPRTANSLGPVSINDVDESGRLYVDCEQRVGKLRVVGGRVRAVFSPSGNLFHLIYRLGAVGEASPAPAAMRPRAALSRAVEFAFGADAPTPREISTNGITTTFRPDRFFGDVPTVELVIVAKIGAPLEQGYFVEASRKSDSMRYHTLVDGKGVVLSNQRRTASDEYRVYPITPMNPNPQTLPGPAPNVASASPNGWVTLPSKAVSIEGNNVHAYLDWDNDNKPVLLGNDVLDGRFVGEADRTIDPLQQQNPLFAVQNVFYHVNLAHDRLWRAGFTEAFGNAQRDNFGRGGVGGDHVLAEAQDSVATNPPQFSNAFANVPKDGGSPRLWFFLCRTGEDQNLLVPRRDTSVEPDIIYHEYGHIVIWRMVDIDRTAAGEAINEGFADVIAMLLSGRDNLAEHCDNSPRGWRRQRYAGYSNTLTDFNPALDEHDNGEIYAAAMWRLHEMMDFEGWDSDAQLYLTIHGLRMTAASPTFLDMRDGLLAASLPDDDCLIWNAFAQFGMGDGAAMNSAGTQITASTTSAAHCLPEPKITISNASATEGNNLNFIVKLSTTWPARVDVKFETGDVKGLEAASGTPTFADSNDLDRQTGIVTFMPGETQRTLSIRTKSDTIFERTERMAVHLKRPSGNARIADNQGVGSIKNRLVNELPTPVGP